MDASFNWSPDHKFPPQDAITEEMVSSSLELLLASDKFYSTPQLCPCAMEPSGACPSCAR